MAQFVLPPDLTAIEKFAGGGSVGIALHDAGFHVALANDFCAKKRAVYAANFPGTRLDPRSIADIPLRDLPYVHLIHFSTPCQDFSIAGLRAGIDGERGSLAFQVTRIIGDARRGGRPFPVGVVENVEGLCTVNKGADFAALVTGLHAEGYAVGAMVIDAARFVPQTRRRLFIVAVLRSHGIPKGLASKRPTKAWHPTTLRNAVAALPPEVRKDWVWWKLPAPPPRTTTLADIIEPDGAHVRWTKPERLAVQAANMRPQDVAALEDARIRGERVGVTLRKRRLNGKGQERTVFQQVVFDGRVRCLTKGEGHEAQQLIFPDDSPLGFRTRDLTPRERARLTGLPDEYVLPKSIKGAQELTGDAVVVDVYRHLAINLLRPLALGGEALPPHVFPRRVRKALDGTSTANRLIKRWTTGVGTRVTEEGRERLGALAAAEGMSLSGYLLACINRDLSARGLPPLVSYVPPPRRPPDGGPRGGGRRKAPRRTHTERKQPVRRSPSGRGAGARSRVSNACTPLRHPGGKAKMASRLVRLLHGSTCLVEPFGGSAAVSIHAILTGAVERAVVAEKEPAIRTLWQVATSSDEREFQSLLEVLGQAQPCGEWWQEFRRRIGDDAEPHLLAARALLASRFHWGGIPGGGLRGNEELRNSLRIATMVRRLEGIHAERRRFTIRADAGGTIAEFGRDPDAAFFVDPPYSIGTGSPAHRLYRHHDVDHAALLGALAQVRGRVVATYPDDPEVHSLARERGFTVEPLGMRDAHRRGRTELLLMRGRPPP